jgi:hypothetical protein
MKLVIMASFAVAAIAQTNSSTGVLGGIISPAPVGVASNGGWTFSSIGPGMVGGAVTGMPYSAEQVTEHVQTLADGTKISQPSPKVMFYRDSQGRTRIERTFPLPPGASAAETAGPSFIEISDPVAGVHYTLEPRNHVARKMSFPNASRPPPQPSPSTASASKAVRILPAIVPAPPGSTSDTQTQRPQFSHESLGTQTIEGVLAEGSRTTVVYPIGAVGNDRPFTTVSETWMSPELKTVVLSKKSDPRNGDSTTRLTNISRSEPDSSLFQIPSDYEAVDPQATVPKQ